MERKGDMEQTVIEKKVAVSKFAADLNLSLIHISEPTRH